MEKINRNNYESYFLDYLEGNLASGRREELISFLEENPDLKEELNGLENFRLGQDQVNFAGKTALKKRLTLSDPGYTIFDELALGRLEEELSEKQVREFDQLISDDPDKKKEFELYKKTLLKPDKKLRYTGKSGLKRGKTIQIYSKTLYRSVALAASILILAGVYFFYPKESNTPYPERLSNQELKFDNENNNIGAMPPSEMDQKNSDLALDNSEIDYNKASNEIKVEKKDPEPLPVNKRKDQPTLKPIQTRYNIQISQEPGYASLIEPEDISSNFEVKGKQFNSYDKVNRFLAKTLDTPIRENLANSNFSLWKIADLSFEGISKLTGKQIMLERHYNEKGNLEKLAFQTESFSFSTNLNK
jgi:hypothetical protein